MKLFKTAIATLALFLITSPVFAQTQSTVDLQAQIAALLEQIQALQIQVTQLGAGGTTAVAATPAPSCVDLGYSLSADQTDELTNGDVTKLQRFLAQDPSIYPSGLITGYFGPQTEAAVQRWQARAGLVSSGSPDTTGYGYVGPRTRAAMACTMQATQSVVRIVSDTVVVQQPSAVVLPPPLPAAAVQPPAIVAPAPTVESPAVILPAPAPTITSFSGKGAGQFEAYTGAFLQIFGFSLAGDTLDTTYVYIGGIRATVTFSSDTRLDVTVPDGLAPGQSYQMYVSNERGRSAIVGLRILGVVVFETTSPAISVVRGSTGRVERNVSQEIHMGVSWATSNIPPTARLDVLRLRHRTTGVEYNILSGIVNDGYERITIPLTTPDGDYAVEIKTSYNGVTAVGISTGYFSLVTVPSSPTISFQATPTDIGTAPSSLLTWSTANANRCVLQSGSSEESVPVNGSKVVSPTQSTSYRLICANDPGTGKDGPSGERTVTVSVVSPSCTLTSNRRFYQLGETITVSWTSQNATYAAFGQDTSGRDSLFRPGDKLETSGSYVTTANVLGSSPLTMVAYNYLGNSLCGTVILVQEDLSLTAPSPGSTYTVGQVVDLQWSSFSSGTDEYQLVVGNSVSGSEFQLYDRVSTISTLPRTQTSYSWTVPGDLFARLGDGASAEAVKDGFYLQVKAINEDSIIASSNRVTFSMAVPE